MIVAGFEPIDFRGSPHQIYNQRRAPNLKCTFSAGRDRPAHTYVCLQSHQNHLETGGSDGFGAPFTLPHHRIKKQFKHTTIIPMSCTGNPILKKGTKKYSIFTREIYLLPQFWSKWAENGFVASFWGKLSFECGDL